MGKGTGKRKIGEEGGSRGEVAKEREKETDRQTNRERTVSPFMRKREPSNQDDLVQLCRPLNTHELAIKCGSGRQEAS